MIPYYSEFNKKNHILNSGLKIRRLTRRHEKVVSESWLNTYIICLHSLHSHLREHLLLMTQRKDKRSNFNLQTGPKEQGKSLSLYSLC